MLNRITISGFKTIRRLDLSLSRLNILIGANGAGKSNFVSFFRMLNSMHDTYSSLQSFIVKAGGANAILHDGAANTPQIEGGLVFQDDGKPLHYRFTLSYAAPDRLFFAKEDYGCTIGNKKEYIELKTEARTESRLKLDATMGLQPQRRIWGLFGFGVFQFHNTSDTARVRQRCSVADNLSLKEDAANLAPFLLRIRESQPRAYNRIVEHVRQIVPFFTDFVLEPDQSTILLRWRERNSDVVFGPHQASDGMIRITALLTLLLQPADNIPAVVILDEPELGLHPHAISIISELIGAISLHKQFIVATQSTMLLDHFEPEDVIVVDRRGRESEFHRLDSEKLRHWLDEYTLAELWEKNVLGGRPSR